MLRQEFGTPMQVLGRVQSKKDIKAESGIEHYLNSQTSIAIPLINKRYRDGKLVKSSLSQRDRTPQPSSNPSINVYTERLP